MATILIIFLRINWPDLMQFKRCEKMKSYVFSWQGMHTQLRVHPTHLVCLRHWFTANKRRTEWINQYHRRLSESIITYRLEFAYMVWTIQLLDTVTLLLVCTISCVIDADTDFNDEWNVLYFDTPRKAQKGIRWYSNDICAILPLSLCFLVPLSVTIVHCVETIKFTLNWYVEKGNAWENLGGVKTIESVYL